MANHTHIEWTCAQRKSTMHRQVTVKVNAPVDEGIAELVSALSEIDGIITLESCQGHPGQRDAFVVFYMDTWRTSGDFLFARLLPAMPPTLRSDVSLRLEAYDTEFARAWITLDPSAIEPMSQCVRQLATAPVRESVLVAGEFRTERWLAECVSIGYDTLATCLTIDPEIRGGVPVLKGTGFTAAQALAELSETSAATEFAERFDIDPVVVRSMLGGLSIILHRPCVKTA